jgi:GTP-binding protein
MVTANQKLAKLLVHPVNSNDKPFHHSIVKGQEPPMAHKKPDSWFIVDLPGYGFAKVSQSSRRKWEQMIENYLRKRENLVSVFILIDSRHPPQQIDLDFLNNYVNGSSIYHCFYKIRQENQRTVAANVKSFFEAMRKTWQFLPQHFVTSAIKKQGRDKILAFIENVTTSILVRTYNILRRYRSRGGSKV